MPLRFAPTWPIRLSASLHAACLGSVAIWPSAWPWIVGALLADHGALAACSLSPRSQALGPALVRLPTAAAKRNEVSLTFDDGPDPEITPKVLDLLAEYDVKGSFFCIGKRARMYPDLVRELVLRGHRVENHSDQHPLYFGFLPPRALYREVATAQRAITEIAGQKPRFFRAPFGVRSPLLFSVLASTGLQAAAWTRRGVDTVSHDPARILRRLMRGLAPGDVLLLHDGSSARTAAGVPVVLEVLPPLLANLAARGLVSVPLL